MGLFWVKNLSARSEVLGMTSVFEVLSTGSVRSVFQPIVELDGGAVVAYEALARGPEGPLATPDALFGAAREAGLLSELDTACRTAAFRGALEQGLLAPLTVFVNVEPEVLDSAPLDDLLAIAGSAPGELRVVMEITERALSVRPADLLRTVERVREFGWAVALDDVGADPLSLAFMALLRPDVVKLDLRLVQERPGSDVAQIMNAVNAYAEQTGALVLAEGIENEQHLTMARALGARLGQGWLFGRPAPGAATDRPVAELALPAAAPPASTELSPFECLPGDVLLRRSPKALLIELSKQLEREAMSHGRTCVVAATFQQARHFTPATRGRYRDLVARTGFVCALGEDLPPEPLPGVRGATLAPGDPVRGEWDVAVVAPHFAAALLARDLGDAGPDLERTFEYALTYQRDTVVRAANALLSRVAPRLPAPQQVPHAQHQPAPAVPAAEAAEAAQAAQAAPASLPGLAAGSAAGAGADAAGEALLHRALAATTSGVTIVAVDHPDQPLIYANSAFEQLSGGSLEQARGRNCRFLQGPDTDPGAVSRIRAAVAAGQECRETLLNYRGPDRTPWWNEIYLAPVTDEHGTVVQYIGVQNDVTDRVDAQRAAGREHDRAQGYLARLEQLAYTDPLTGLANRRRLQEQLEAAVWEARAGGTALALLFLDLDGFKAVNDRLGHSAGDELLVRTGQRLKARLRRSDLLARLGGDEFLAALPGLDASTARGEADRIAAQLTAALAEPMVLAGEPVAVTVSIGVAVYPHDGADFGALLHHADLRMYAGKHPHRTEQAAQTQR